MKSIKIPASEYRKASKYEISKYNNSKRFAESSMFFVFTTTVLLFVSVFLIALSGEQYQAEYILPVLLIGFCVGIGWYIYNKNTDYHKYLRQNGREITTEDLWD